MKFRDYYDILGIDKNADDKTIKNAYRKLAKKYHPDLNAGSEEAAEKLKEVNEAYEVLSDRDKRQKYDQFEADYDMYGGQNFDPSQYGYDGHSYTYTSTDGDFSDFFNMFFGGGGQSRSSSMGGFDLGDLFAGQTSSRNQRPSRRQYNMDISLSLEEAYQGGEKSVSVNLQGQNKTIKIKWPAGISSGKKIKIKGEAQGIEGDILAKVSVISKDKIEGNNITKTITLTPWQAYFGKKERISTLTGDINVNIPPKVTNGKKVRIPKKGFKDMKGRVGDLYIELKIDNPASLSSEQETLYKQLQALDN